MSAPRKRRKTVVQQMREEASTFLPDTDRMLDLARRDVSGSFEEQFDAHMLGVQQKHHGNDLGLDDEEWFGNTPDGPWDGD